MGEGSGLAIAAAIVGIAAGIAAAAAIADAMSKVSCPYCHAVFQKPRQGQYAHCPRCGSSMKVR